MTKVIDLEVIKKTVAAIGNKELLSAIEKGFILYSQKRVIVPPVGHLALSERNADVHIKYGFIKDDDYYVVKIASGFYENSKIGLPTSNGLMLVFSQRTGEVLAILLDEGYLTDIRTALAGAVVAKYLAPKEIKAVGIVGTGIQARLQLKYLKDVITFNKVFVYGRNNENLAKYISDMKDLGVNIQTTQDITTLTENCNYIVTTTPSSKPILFSNQIKAGTHITAMGADSKGKQELDPLILGKSDIILADSLPQCLDHGEIFYGIDQKIITESNVIELGEFISQGLRRSNDQQVTVADITGVAIQDIQIATAVYNNRFVAF